MMLAAAVGLMLVVPTGNDLLAECEKSLVEGHASVAGVGCLSYVRGFMDAAGNYEVLMELTQATLGSTTPESAKRATVGPWICVPDEVNAGQLLRVVIKFLGDHPERLHQQRGILTFDALKAAFPCARK